MAIVEELEALRANTLAAIDGAALLVMAGALLIIALPLRRPFRRLNNFFEEQLEKTGYM